MSTLTVTVKERTSKGKTSVEGSYQLPSSTTTKLQRKDGSTSFPKRAAMNQSARRLATALGWKLAYNEPTKKAAKKSVKSKTSKSKKGTSKKK